MEYETPAKIKYICRLQEGQYVEQSTAPLPSETAAYAELFLHAFSPERLLRQLSLETSQQAVLVFRTDTRQMAEFREALETCKTG